MIENTGKNSQERSIEEIIDQGHAKAPEEPPVDATPVDDGQTYSEDGPGVPDFTTPEEAPPVAKSHPKRGMKKRILGGGEGDVCVMQIAPEHLHKHVPKGTLIPIPDVPRFETTRKAERWIEYQSGDLLVGKQIAMVKFSMIARLEVENKPKVRVIKKPPVRVVHDPEVSDG